MASPSKRKKPAGDEAEFGTEWAERLRNLPETEKQRQGARGLLRHRLKLHALPADNPDREGLADLTDADILNSIRDRAERDRLDVEFDALVKLPDEGPTALADRWGRLADWGLRRFSRRGSVDFTEELWVRGLAGGFGLGDDGPAVASLPADGNPLKLRWLAALQSATDALAVAARDLVKLKRLDAADLRAVRVLADLLVKVDEGGCVDLRESVDAVAIVAGELAAMPGKRDARDNDAVEQRKAEERAWVLSVVRQHKARAKYVADVVHWVTTAAANEQPKRASVPSRDTIKRHLLAAIENGEANASELPPLGK